MSALGTYETLLVYLGAQRNETLSDVAARVLQQRTQPDYILRAAEIIVKHERVNGRSQLKSALLVVRAGQARGSHV